MIIRWHGPGNDRRFLLRKMAILQADKNGMPSFGIMTLKDITPMVSSVKANNIDITFHPERSDLRCELMRRIRSVQPKRQSHFTVRELEIIKCLSKGMSSKEIAGALFISKATVDTHRQNLIHKWEVTNTAALLKLAMEEGCI
jgi:DNA-binding NarL/FixJ family response regulator